MEDKKRLVAIVALVVGVIALGGAVCIGLCGAMLAVLGLVLSIVALVMKSLDGNRGRTIAIVGVVINALALIVSAINMMAGFWLMQSGQHPLFQVPQPQADAAVLSEADAGGAMPLMPWPETDAGPEP